MLDAIERHPSETVHAQMLEVKSDGTRTKKIKIMEKGYNHMESKWMTVADNLSRVVRRVDLANEELAVTRATATAATAKAAEELAVMGAMATAAAARADAAVIEAEAEAGRVARRAKAKFRAGQSCFHYWAKWMPGCTHEARPDQINKKKIGRPAWFSSEIASPAEWQERVHYGGTLSSGYTYLVY